MYCKLNLFNQHKLVFCPGSCQSFSNFSPSKTFEQWLDVISSNTKTSF